MTLWFYQVRPGVCLARFSFGALRFRCFIQVGSVLVEKIAQAMNKLDSTVNAYRQLLNEVDDWFTTCLQAGGSTLSCRGGCSACCRALFDITLLDAWMLKEAFADLT